MVAGCRYVNFGKKNMSIKLRTEKYVIHIGDAYNMETQTKDAKIKIVISKEQFDIIDFFADVETDEELNKTYILNKCRFKVVPHFHLETENDTHAQ